MKKKNIKGTDSENDGIILSDRFVSLGWSKTAKEK
tara:strand:- start:304 stop:408 length:105 start_codon:yes stop_codon:yes gene_type:complete